MESVSAQCGMSFSRKDGDTLLVHIAGDCRIGKALPSADEVQKQVEAGSGIKKIIFESEGVTDWDSGLLTFIIRIIDRCSKNNIHVDINGLPQGVQRLLDLASAVPEKKGARREVVESSFLTQMGEAAIDLRDSSIGILDFIGDVTSSFGRLLLGRARYRRSELFVIIQDCGPKAFFIVSLISLLVGLILAFIGAIQLRMFGAQIYIADLVGIGMVRVMGAIMTGIIMAGRTGAAFAAQIGTMQVNEEIDALETMGISPIEFLVLPRIIALTLMMPLLCLYADLMGILGGMIVGVGMMDLTVMEYVMETKKAVSMDNLWIGLFHSVVFGVLVSMSGCLRGMQCGRSASSVGDAGTSAVVTGIVSIIVATAVITFVCQVIGI
ncbi:MAG: ABC transporter permease [Thermodesulfovibrionia bacterium]|nr:ABC transporter permease [Thermodesulfovibrionia bacterium]